MLRDVVKVFPVSSSSFARKEDREESSTKSLGGMTRPKDEMGSQIISSESDICHSILVYLSRNNKLDIFQLWRLRSLNFQSFSDPSEIRWRVRGAREAPASRDSQNFRRASLLSRNEFESGTFTIVLHATSSFTYVSVIYGANFPFKFKFRVIGRSSDGWPRTKWEIDRVPFVSVCSVHAGWCACQFEPLLALH